MSFEDILKKIQKKFAVTKSMTIGDTVFEIGLLTLDEEQKAGSIPSDLDGMVYFNEMRKTMLSYSIRKIDGEEIPQFVETTENGNPVTKERPVVVREFLATLPPKVTEDLFEAYIDLRESSDDALDKTMKWDWYKTPEQRAEERKKKAEEATKAEEAAAAKLATASLENAPSTDQAPVDKEVKLTFIPDTGKDEEDASQPSV